MCSYIGGMGQRQRDGVSSGPSGGTALPGEVGTPLESWSAGEPPGRFEGDLEQLGEPTGKIEEDWEQMGEPPGRIEDDLLSLGEPPGRI